MATAADLPFVVKVCGIKNEEEALAAVHAGANALGFNFYPKSPRYLTFQRAAEIMAALSGPYLRVGVFVNPSEEDLLRAEQIAPLDVFQLHGERCPASLYGGRRIWRAIEPNQTAPSCSSAEAYLLDSPSSEYGGSGRTFDWKLAAGRSGRTILAGGLDGSNVAEAIEAAAPWGVDACSRLESHPGKKDAAQVRAFVCAALAKFSALRHEYTAKL